VCVVNLYRVSVYTQATCINLRHRPPLPQEKSLVLTLRCWVDPRAHGSVGGYHGKKSPVTPPGIDPGTVRLVAQRLNHYATPGRIFCNHFSKIFTSVLYLSVARLCKISQCFNLRHNTSLKMAKKAEKCKRLSIRFYSLYLNWFSGIWINIVKFFGLVARHLLPVATQTHVPLYNL